MTMLQPEPPGIILVEGQDDRHFIDQICRKNPRIFAVETETRNSLQIISKENQTKLHITEADGRDTLLKILSAAAKTEGRQILGVVIDADKSLRKTWTDLNDALQAAEITLPPKPPAKGLIIPEKPELTPRIGIWIMPDNQSPGELEDFVLQMIPENHPAWAPAKNFIAELPRKARKFSKRKTPKAQLYAWLSTRQDPAHMGPTLRRGDLDPQTPLCRLFTAWLQRLLGSKPS